MADQTQPQVAPAPAQGAGPNDGVMDALMRADAQQPQAPAPVAPQPAAPAAASSPAAAPAAAPSGGGETVHMVPVPAGAFDKAKAEQPLIDDQAGMGATALAAAGGVAQGLFAAKDLFTGTPPEAERSNFRQSVDGYMAGVSENDPIDSLVGGISQFGIGMLGAGKIAAVAKAAPAVKAGVAAMGRWAESTKAAAVGATFFDPHSENFANIVQKVPALSNPVTQFLSSSPNDGDALGRAKNAMASIGLDAAITGVFAAGLKVTKAMRGGDPADIAAAHGELDTAMQAEQAGREQIRNPSQPEAGREQIRNPSQPEAGTPQGAAIPASTSPKLPEYLHFGPTGVKTSPILGKSLWHETSPENAASLLKEDMSNDATGIKGSNLFVADNPDIAIGQSGKGVRIEYNGDLVSAVEHKKPGTGDLAGREYRTNATGNNSIRSIVVAPGTEFSMPGSWGPRFAHDFEAKTLEDGSTQYTRKSAAASQPQGPTEEPDTSGYYVYQGVSAARGGAAPGGPQLSPYWTSDLSKAREYASPGGFIRAVHSSDLPPDFTSGALAPGGPGEPGVVPQLKTTAELPSHLPDDQILEELHKRRAQQSQEEPQPQPEVSVVQSPTSGATGGKLPPKPNLITLSDEQVSSLIDHSRADSDAIIKFGSWDNAVDAGHVFGDQTNSIPWQKFAADGNVQSVTQSLDALTARLSDTLQAEYASVKGGDVISDAMNSNMVGQRARLWNEDPAALLGLLQAAGKHSIQLRANMDAAFLVGQRAMQDAYTLAARINAGYYEEFGGSRAAAIAAFKQVQEIAATAYAQGNAMSSNAGRALRGMRGDFQPNPTDIAALRSVDPEVMLQVMAGTKGDPRAIIKALQPKLWEPGGLAYAAKQFGEAAQFLLVNNLVSNPLTHAVILATNAYQVVSRPMERFIGSLATGEAGGAIRQQALKQYTYMAASLHDSFRQAVKAFNVGDSIIAPHTVETNAANTSLGQTVAQLPWKPFDSVSNILYNTLTFAAKAEGLPTRFVGAQDELIKQIVYRSKVLADAHVAGVTQGLDGDALTAHVQQALSNAFDSAGHATDTAALNEARIATFQQDLPETGNFGLHTFSKTVNNAANYFPPARVVLPFVRTPANLFRNGVKLTPGLNMLQQEYRQAIAGAFGPEQQAQAVGQMATGSLFMGVAAMLAYEGRITGGGPSDPRAKAALLDSGWRPYSFVLPHADGTRTYAQFGRLDPVAMPFGMVADTMDAAMHPDPVIQSKAKPMAEAMATSLLKSMTDKLYLRNLSTLIEAISDPDATMWKVAGSYASNYVPYASALRLVNPDPNMREARTFIDQAKRGIPGFSESVPARRDAFGEPVTVHKGIWLTDNGSIVDHEVTRMASEQDLALGPPTPHATGGVDLRNLTMMDGSNAYDKLQELSAQPAPGMPRLKDQTADLIKSEAYQRAPDGPDNIRGTRLSMMLDLAHRYRNAASRIVSADPNVRAAETAQRRATAAAYAAKSPSPTPMNRQSELLTNLGKSFGVDMHSLIGATGAPTPAPLAGPTVK